MSMSDHIRHLNERRSFLTNGGGAEKNEKQHKKGKLTARERIDYLLDEDSFSESSRLPKAACPGPEMLRETALLPDTAQLTDGPCICLPMTLPYSAGRSARHMRKKSQR